MEISSHFIYGIPYEAMLRITLAALMGGIIGIEREWRGHPAGLRTNMLVAIGSCLFTLLSIDGFPLRGAAQDTARIAAQVVSGVGFLGAGAVLQTKNHTKGLTTAATVWLVAAVGMGAGVGAYAITLYTTLLTTVVLALLLPVSERIESRSRRRSKLAAPTVPTPPAKDQTSLGD